MQLSVKRTHELTAETVNFPFILLITLCKTWKNITCEWPRNINDRVCTIFVQPIVVDVDGISDHTRKIFSTTRLLIKDNKNDVFDSVAQKYKGEWNDGSYNSVR